MTDKIKYHLRRIINITGAFLPRLSRRGRIMAAAVCGLAVLLLAGLFFIRGQEAAGAKEAGEQIARLAQNIRNRYQTRPDYWGLSTAEVIRQKINPLSMAVADGRLKGCFGNDVQVGADAEGTAVMPTGRTFVIACNGLNRRQCVALAANKADPAFWLGVEGLRIKNAQTDRLFDWSTKELVLPASAEQAKKYCQTDNNYVIFYFK